MSTEKESVALTSIVASGAMTLGKFAVGLLTGSLGLMAEGAHSLLDLGATIITYMAVRISDKPADECHPYGHGKVESVAALLETGLLFLTSAGIVYEAVQRLLSPNVVVEVTWWSIGVVVASILIDIFRARALSRVAKKTRSQALEADALHFSSDVLSSAVVLIGLGFVAMGWPKGDAFSALGVALFVTRAGWQLGRRTIDTLIDTAPEGVAEKVRAVVTSWPSVLRVLRVRVRPVGPVSFINVDIAVSRGLSLERVNVLQKEIAAALREKLEGAEVTIVVHPQALDNETVHQRVTILAANQQLPIHHVTVHQAQGHLAISFDLEVDGNLTINAAHALTDTLEASIRAELGDDVEVETHIDPLQTKQLTGEDVALEVLDSIHATVQRLAAPMQHIRDIHAVRARQTDQGLIVLFHCTVDPKRTVMEIHETVDALEQQIRDACSGVWRVVGHAEPDRRL